MDKKFDVVFEKSSDDKLIVGIDGEINTATAKILSDMMSEQVSLADNVVLDFAKVPYITSAGLRVIMKKDEEQRSFGSFALRNVNKEIMEILEMVKFTEFITIEGCEHEESEESQNLGHLYMTEYVLTETELDLLNPRVRFLYEQGNLKCLAALDDDSTMQGYLSYMTSKSGKTVYILSFYENDKCKDKTLKKQLIEKLKQDASEGVAEFIYISFAETNGEETAEELHLNKLSDKNTILNYEMEQILNSALWKKIDKLRTMFDRVKMVNELDYVEKMELIPLLGEFALEEIDPLYARVFIVDGQIKGLMNAQEVKENDIWISQIKILPCNEANYGPVLLFASLVSVMSVLSGDHDQIHLVLDKESQVKAFKQILGEPMTTTEDCFYQI